MNFFRGKLVRADGLQLQCKGAALPLGSPAGLDAYVGKELIVGIRPESLRVSPGDPLHIGAQLDVVEPVGNEVFLHLTWGANAIVVREPMQELPARGSTLMLNFATSSLHFFDAQTEKRIETP
jgi:multiple sugar transport system ATP-binding protein